MNKVTREKELAVPIQSMYEVITDFESYPDFLPEVVSATKLPNATEERASVRFQIEVIKKFDYVLDFEMKPGEEVIWRLAESNLFKTNQGHWKLKSLGDSNTHVDYQVEVALGFLVPKWVVKKLTANSLPKMFDNFENRAKSS